MILVTYSSGARQLLICPADVAGQFIADLSFAIAGISLKSQPSSTSLTLHVSGGTESFSFAIPSFYYSQLNNLYQIYKAGSQPTLISIQQGNYTSKYLIDLDTNFLTLLFEQVDSMIHGTFPTGFQSQVVIHYLTDSYPTGNWGWAEGTPTNPGNDG